MPRYEVRPLNLFADYMAGRDAAQQERVSLQQNQLRDQQIQRGQRLNALAADPNATPEQYVRAGDAQTGAALSGVQDKAQAEKQQAISELGMLAQKTLALPPEQRKAFTRQAMQAYGDHFKALGIDVTQGLSQLDQTPDAQFEQNLKNMAQFAPAPKQTTVAAGATLGTTDASGKFTPSYTAPNPGQEETARHNRAMEKAANDRISLGANSLSGGGLDLAAQDYLTSRKLTGNAAMRAKILARASEMAAESGDNAQSALIKSYAFQANQTAQKETLKQFTAGKKGDTVRSLNVAVQHLDQLDQLGKALGNGDLQMLNKLGNAWSKSTGKPAPNTFEGVKKIVTDEVVKAVIGAGGGVADREEAASTISSAQSSSQLSDMIANYKGLMAGQLNGLRQQYKEGTNRDDFERFLLPVTKAELENHAEGGSPAAAPTKRAPPEAISYLQQHPELKEQFKAKYGYLP